MKIAITTDEIYPVHQTVIDWLIEKGHSVSCFGALAANHDMPWVQAAVDAVKAIESGQCDEAIIFCWSGTGICMAANRFPFIRSALCTDAETARAARVWNHANVLALSNRLLSQDLAKEILTAWFEDYDREKGAKGVAELSAISVLP